MTSPNQLARHVLLDEIVLLLAADLSYGSAARWRLKPPRSNAWTAARRILRPFGAPEVTPWQRLPAAGDTYCVERCSVPSDR
jgi:hypothetical protein